MHAAGRRNRRALARGDFRKLRERAPLKVSHQNHDAHADHAKRADGEEHHLLRTVRRVRVARALGGDGFFERLNARGQRGGVGGGFGGGLLAAVGDRELRGVKLFLDLQIAVHHRLRRGVRRGWRRD